MRTLPVAFDEAVSSTGHCCLHLNSKRVMVTGGAGFLGSHLCERLLADGNHVICIDSLQTGRRSNIRHLLRHPRFYFIEHDVTDPFDAEVEEIYNLASPASPVDYQADPIKTTRTSVLGAMNVLDIGVRQGAKVLQASTSEVYGDPAVHPQPESYFGNVNPIGPRACYDEGKRCAESLFFDYARVHGVNIRVARIFNTYGPRMRSNDGRVVSNFVVQALRGENLTIHGDGSQTRSFCFADDLVDGLVRLMDASDALTGPINLGNPGEFTIRQLADIVLEMTDTGSSITPHPIPQDDPKQRKPDITRAKQLLGWEPRIDLRRGLEKTIEYFRTRIGENRAQGMRLTM